MAEKKEINKAKPLFARRWVKWLLLVLVLIAVGLFMFLEGANFMRRQMEWACPSHCADMRSRLDNELTGIFKDGAPKKLGQVSYKYEKDKTYPVKVRRCFETFISFPQNEELVTHSIASTTFEVDMVFRPGMNNMLRITTGYERSTAILTVWVKKYKSEDGSSVEREYTFFLSSHDNANKAEDLMFSVKME